MRDRKENLVRTDLESRAARLERRDLQLWSISVLVLLVMASGFVAVTAPELVWRLPDGRPVSGKMLPQLFFGFIALVVLFNIYILQQKRRLRDTREELISELLYRQQAEKLSLLDPLTETYNRRYMEEMLGKDLARIQRQGSTATFVMVDVDTFKQVNSKFGHLVGDQVLAEVARVLRRAFRASDTIVRFGGDEFLILLESSDAQGAVRALDRLKARVEEWNRMQVIHGYTMSLSWGAAEYDPTQSLEEVLSQADRRMYANKAKSAAGV